MQNVTVVVTNKMNYNGTSVHWQVYQILFCFWFNKIFPERFAMSYLNQLTLEAAFLIIALLMGSS